MKFTKYFLALSAALGMAACMQKEDLVMLPAAEDVVAPVLEEISGPVEITPTNMAMDNVVFQWSAADYGIATEINYSIEAQAGELQATIVSGIVDTAAVIKHNVTYELLNQILFNDLKLADGVAEEVSFKIGSKVGNYEKVYSNVIKVSCKATAAEKVYPMIYMPGSYQGWDPAGAETKFQVLYDFAGNGVFEGIADFGQANDEGRAWKFTRQPNWDFDWGIPEGETPDAEAAEVTLHNNDNGGRSDIKIYTVNRYYHFSMDTNTGLLKKNFAFDQIGVIGSFNSWAGDVVMEFNAAKKRFYADVEFAEDGQFKLRANADWAMNWGADAFGVSVSNGDGNLEAKAGNYRVYAYMSNPAEMTIELVAGMYGKEEVAGGSTTPEPEPEPEPVVQGWGLVGEYNSWGGSPDVMLVSDGTYLVAKGVELSGQVKFRKDADWATNFGAPGDVEPVEITVNTELELAAGGKNFTIAAGTYDVYLDETNAKAWFINDGSYPGGGAAPVEAEWGLIGSLAACNNWSNNVKLYVSGDYSVAKGVEFAAGDQFKFRKGEAWGVELTYEGAITIDAKLDLIDGTGGKKNSSISEAGTYDVYLANDLSAFYVMTPGKTPADAGEAQKVYTDPTSESFVVGFSGSAIGWDDPSFDANDRAAFVSKNVTDATTFAGTYEFKLEGFTVAENDEFKVRINGQWIGAGEGGATVEGLTVTGGDNFVAGEAGTYNVTITFAWDGSTHSDVKAVFAGASAPADPWAAATSYDLPESASSSRQVIRNIKYYADAANVNIRLTVSAEKLATEGKVTDFVTIMFYDVINGTTGAGFYGWWNDAKGNNEFAAEHCGVVSGTDLTLAVAGTDIPVVKTVDGDLVTWEFAIPRSVNAVLGGEKVYMGILTMCGWDATGAMPDKYADMLEVTLP